ncbi:hypothetical protein [Citrobacter sedlakii]|uniref:hypothetical protein n=1 Tax=Citrobacter sedlakii TaxID=67826 RepID=UPI0020C08E25|nr:hypothetical protein [Citrobacter sedlakii]MCK8147045.1 hypothetical protein [Citrobacter sedlakii]
MKSPLDPVKEEWAVYSKRDISAIKKMTAAERKTEAMRQLKASFDRAACEGTLHVREVTPS